MDALNKSLALILWAKDENGKDDVAVFPGTLVLENNIYFLQRKDNSRPEIKSEWLSRIKEIPKELKPTLSDCEYQLSLTVEDVGKDTKSLEKNGLKWPV